MLFSHLVCETIIETTFLLFFFKLDKLKKITLFYVTHKMEY